MQLSEGKKFHNKYIEGVLAKATTQYAKEMLFISFFPKRRTMSQKDKAFMFKLLESKYKNVRVMGIDLFIRYAKHRNFDLQKLFNRLFSILMKEKSVLVKKCILGYFYLNFQDLKKNKKAAEKLWNILTQAKDYHIRLNIIRLLGKLDDKRVLRKIAMNERSYNYLERSVAFMINSSQNWSTISQADAFLYKTKSKKLRTFVLFVFSRLISKNHYVHNNISFFKITLNRFLIKHLEKLLQNKEHTSKYYGVLSTYHIFKTNKTIVRLLKNIYKQEREGSHIAAVTYAAYLFSLKKLQGKNFEQNTRGFYKNRARRGTKNDAIYNCCGTRICISSHTLNFKLRKI